LREGEQVVEVRGGEFLAAGEAGTLVQDDGSGVPFKVRNPAGDTHWYSERDLQRPDRRRGSSGNADAAHVRPRVLPQPSTQAARCRPGDPRGCSADAAARGRASANGHGRQGRGLEWVLGRVQLPPQL